MAVVEKINQAVEKLPHRLQAEVLDFVEFLLSKNEADAQENESWSQGSLSLAMQGMEEEDGPEYSVSDLKEAFS